MRYFVRFSYKGTPFHGSQRQSSGAVTVQEVMEHAFSTILRRDVALTFAGRTDAGVHACEMYAHFNGPAVPPQQEGLTGEDLQYAVNGVIMRLNGLLPESIAVHAIVPVADEANARFSAVSRTYEYHTIDYKDPFSVNLATLVRPGLDFDAMNRAAVHLLGRQDFMSFSKTKTDVKTTFCDISRAEWVVSEDGHRAVFTITANRFLRNMVRAIVGTLFDVGRGKISEEDFTAVIADKNRCSAGESAPAEGLYLTHVEYPEEIFTDKNKTAFAHSEEKS